MSAPIATLYADPPWAFGDKLPGKGRGAEKHYATLTTPEIMRFPLPEMAPHCRLFLWRVAAMQQDALDVMHAWGFTLKAEVVWVKVQPGRINPDGTPRLQIGMGRQVRMAHEVCLIGVRGRPAQLDKGVPSVIFAPRGEHSAKPQAMYDLMERLSPGPYAEMFARGRRAGWDAYGDEVE